MAVFAGIGVFGRGYEVGRYYSAFFHGFKRVGRTVPQALITARLKNGMSNNPSSSSLIVVNCDMDVPGPPLPQHIG
jgi:hypothetical protein